MIFRHVPRVLRARTNSALSLTSLGKYDTFYIDTWNKCYGKA